MAEEKKPKERKTTNCVFEEVIIKSDAEGEYKAYKIVAPDLKDAAAANKWILEKGMPGLGYFIGTIAKQCKCVQVKEERKFA